MFPFWFRIQCNASGLESVLTQSKRETKVVSNSLPRNILSTAVSAAFLDGCIHTDCFSESPGAGFGTGFSVGCRRTRRSNKSLASPVSSATGLHNTSADKRQKILYKRKQTSVETRLHHKGGLYSPKLAITKQDTKAKTVHFMVENLICWIKMRKSSGTQFILLNLHQLLIIENL